MTPRLDPDRVRLTLGHVARYRLTTPEAVRTVPPLRLTTNAIAVGWLRQLVAGGWLGEAPLDRHGPYFYLTARGAREVIGRDSDGRAGPLSEPAKLRAFALLAFCRLAGANRERLSADDLRRLVSGLDTGGMPSTFYAERSETTRALGFARIDAGGHGRWDRILATVAADRRAFAADPAVRPLLAARGFEVALVTPTAEKAERLRAALADRDPSPVPVRVVAVPRLLTLAGSIRSPRGPPG
jgi:hypothetical protein